MGAATPNSATDGVQSQPTPANGAAAAGDAITLTLGAACVAPGGRQSLTIDTGTLASISFDTRYADGSLGSTNGGAGIGRTNADGIYRTQWTVSTAAPPGPATVSAGASRDGRLWTSAPATFTVAARC